MLEMHKNVQRSQNGQNLLNIKIHNNPNKKIHIKRQNNNKNRIPNKQPRHETIRRIIETNNAKRSNV